MKEKSDVSRWDIEADVVIVGSGDAGLSAAIESADVGADTIVFEKLGTLRATSSAMSGGKISFAGTDLQQQEGIEDSNDLYFRDLMDVGDWKNDRKLVEAFISKQLDTYYWLTALGVKWLRLALLGGMSVPRAHVADPVGHVMILKGAAEKRGVRILFRNRVTGLLTDEGRRVIGVYAEGEGQSLRVKAKKGVVLATGGFGRDIKRLKSIDPRLAEVAVIAGAGHTGDGHRMAEELGAYFEHMEPESLKPSLGIHAASQSFATMLLMYWAGAILVNKTGMRFINESADVKSIGMASLGQPDGIVYQIFDHKIFENERLKGFGGHEKAARLFIRTETVDELASEAGIPPEALKKTIDKYNNDVDGGKDSEFGRNTLTKRQGKVIRIDTPPFYAYASKLFLPGTYKGLVVDENMHILSAHGKIPGLYAAGELVGGFHGVGYHSGSALAKALVFGRIAGRNSACGY